MSAQESTEKEYRERDLSRSQASFILDRPFGIKNQGDLNCCVSMALCTAMEIIDYRDGDAVELSPLYHFQRINSPVGMKIRRGLDFAVRYGIAPYELHEGVHGIPYGSVPPEDWEFLNISSAAKSAAKNYKIKKKYDPDSDSINSYRSIPKSNMRSRFRTLLSLGNPILIRFPDSFHYRDTLQNGATVLTDGDSMNDGPGHCAVVNGFNSKGFNIIDSRGVDFGDSGEWLLPFKLVKKIIKEAWYIGAVVYS